MAARATETAEAPWNVARPLAALARAPDRPAVVEIAEGAARETSRHELARLVAGIAGALGAAGIERGEVVALWAPNSARWIAAALAVARIGAVLAPLDAMSRTEDAARAIEGCGARLVLADADRAEALGPAPPVLSLSEIAPADPEADLPAPDPDAPMAVFRTSGTTGAPKVFRLTERNIATVVQALLDWGGVREADRVLLPLPMHHVYPLITAALPALSLGATVVLPESPTGAHIREAFAAGRPTVLIGVPRLFEAMLDGIDARLAALPAPAVWAVSGLLGLAGGLSRASGGRIGPQLLAPLRRKVAGRLRLLVSGGAKLKPEVADRLEAFGWVAHSGYGLSETASAFAGTFAGKRRGSVGRPLAGCEARIEAPDAEGVGEIVLRGPSVFSGYLDNPEANSAAFTEDGFFRSGDLGRIDADGFLYVVGRAKEAIVLSGGDTLFPEDVEAAYLAHPHIAEIGVLERDGALAALVRPEGAKIAADRVVDIRRAISVALSQTGRGLPSTWRIGAFALTREALPRTRIGKIRRFLLPGLFDEAEGTGGGHGPRALTEQEEAWASVPPRAEARACLERAAPGKAYDLDSHLQIDLGLDSFSWMTLAVDIEEAVGVRLDLADIAEIDTVRDLLERVSEKAEAPGEDGPPVAARLAEDARWLRPRSGLERALGSLLHWANRRLLRTLCGLSVKGAEGLPREGPLLLCPNHASMLDAPAIAAAAPGHLRARLAWAADKRVVFGSPVFRLLCRPMRAFPVDQAMPTVAVELAERTLAEGAAQVWFAEGWQSPDGEIMPFKPGVARILETARPQVVPVRISGTFEAWPRDARWPRLRPIGVVFGAPVAAETLIAEAEEAAQAADEAPDGEARRRRIAAAIEARVRALGPAS